MAKAMKRWAVRVECSYELFIGSKPRGPFRELWKRNNYVGGIGWRCFERFMPKCYHLKPGEMVEMKFADEE